MATSQPTNPRTSQIEGMPDLILGNIPVDTLRSIVRDMLMTDLAFTSAFEVLTRKYLNSTKSLSNGTILSTSPEQKIQLDDAATALIRRIRTMSGCGMYYESLPILQSIAEQVTDLKAADATPEILAFLIKLDSDIIEIITGVYRTQQVESGLRELSADERVALEGLRTALVNCEQKWQSRGQEFLLGRGLATVQRNLNPSTPMGFGGLAAGAGTLDIVSDSRAAKVETWQLGGQSLPRIFSGLWQLASPEFGSASLSKMNEQFLHHAQAGFTAFDMADHYGDAEIIFGQFRKSLKNPGAVFGSTKYCVFSSLTVTREAVRANISQRCARMQSNKIDLLQVHWQIWEDPQYVEILRLCQEDERVVNLGLCNYDTAHMKEAFEAGIRFNTNQSQFSLVDSRPTVKMGAFCTENNIKLLTFGSLCGGFISQKWLGKPAPEIFSEDMTPSTRLYFKMITSWGGWELFQELLGCLKSIAVKRDVSIANVATRWVLDFPYVGAVIVGARMGVSARVDDNAATYGWRLDEEDQNAIEAVLKKSRRAEMFEEIGDCGYEYR